MTSCRRVKVLLWTRSGLAQPRRPPAPAHGAPQSACTSAPGRPGPCCASLAPCNGGPALQRLLLFAAVCLFPECSRGSRGVQGIQRDVHDPIGRRQTPPSSEPAVEYSTKCMLLCTLQCRALRPNMYGLQIYLTSE